MRRSALASNDRDWPDVVRQGCGVRNCARTTFRWQSTGVDEDIHGSYSRVPPSARTASLMCKAALVASIPVAAQVERPAFPRSDLLANVRHRRQRQL